MSLLSHLESQQAGPFARASSHQERVAFVVAECQRLGSGAVKKLIRKHDLSEKDSTFHGMFVVFAAQYIRDTELLASYLENHPSDFVRRRAAKALSRLGQSDLLQRCLFGEEVSVDNKDYLVDLILSMPKAVVSPQVVDLVSSLRSKNTSLALACRCGDLELVQKHLVEPLSGDDLPSHYTFSARLVDAVTSALRKFPSLAEELLRAKLCPQWMQELILQVVGKKRLTKPGPDGAPSFLDIYINCPYRDTAWFLRHYVPHAQKDAVKMEFDPAANQSDLLLPICAMKEFFDEELLWVCKARNLKDPLGCLELIRSTAAKRPSAATSEQAKTHLRLSNELRGFVEDDRRFPCVGIGKRRAVAFELLAGANYRDKLAWPADQPAQKRALTFCKEWEHTYLLRSWHSEEQVLTLLADFPHIIMHVPARLPDPTALSILRRVLGSDDADSGPAEMLKFLPDTETMMVFLYVNARDLFHLQARRFEKHLPDFDLETAPSWLVHRLPYRKVQQHLKAACRVKEVPGMASRAGGLSGLVACAKRSGGWALDDALQFMVRSLRNERDDVKEEVIAKVFDLLLDETRASDPPVSGESAWDSSAGKRAPAGDRKRRKTDSAKKSGGGGGEGEAMEVEGEDGEEWMVVEIDEHTAASGSKRGQPAGADKPDTRTGKASGGASAEPERVRKDDDVVLGPRHTEILDRLLMLTLQAKRASCKLSWLNFACRILTRALLFGQGPAAPMVRFAYGVSTKLVEAKVQTEEAKTLLLQVVHATLSRCKLFGGGATGKVRKRGAGAWTAEAKFIIEAAKAVEKGSVESETLMLILVEDSEEAVRHMRLRALLSSSFAFARLVHHRRQELLDPLVSQGPGTAIPPKVVYESYLDNNSRKQKATVRSWEALTSSLAVLQATDPEASRKRGRASGPASVRGAVSEPAWQKGAQWEAADHGPSPPADFDWQAAGHFYSRNALLSARPAYLGGLFRWHPRQQAAAFERWILPASNESRFPIDLKTKARVLASGAGMLLAPGRLESVAARLAECGKGFGDEELDPADRAFLGQVGDQLVHALGKEDRPREAIDVLVKHCFSGLAKGAVAQLGVVMRRVGLSSIEHVIRGVHQDSEVRVGGRVALARTTVDLDLPKPELLLLQWAHAECHRDVAVALLVSLLRRPHLTEAHPQLLVQPLQDLEAKLLASADPGIVAKGTPEALTEFPVYVSTGLLSQVCKDRAADLPLSWVQGVAGKALVRFVIKTVEHCRGPLREKGLLALYLLLCGVGLGLEALREEATLAGGAVNKVMLDAFRASDKGDAEGKQAQMTLKKAATADRDMGGSGDKTGSDRGEVYALATRLLVALAHDKWLGLSYVVDVISAVLTHANGSTPGAATKALAIAGKMLEEAPAAWGCLEAALHGTAQRSKEWYASVEEHVLSPLLRSVLHAQLGGSVGAWLVGSMWTVVGLKAEAAGAQVPRMLERVCEICEQPGAPPAVGTLVVQAAVDLLSDRLRTTHGVYEKWETRKQWVVSSMVRVGVGGGKVRGVLCALLARLFLAKSDRSDAGSPLLATVQDQLSALVASSDLQVQALAMDIWLKEEVGRAAEVKWDGGVRTALRREGRTSAGAARGGRGGRGGRGCARRGKGGARSSRGVQKNAGRGQRGGGRGGGRGSGRGREHWLGRTLGQGSGWGAPPGLGAQLPPSMGRGRGLSSSMIRALSS